MSVGAYVGLSRPGNAFLAAAGVLTGGVLVSGQASDQFAIGLAAASALFGVAGGNALNDARDAQLDRIAHPERPIPRGRATARSAANFAGVCLALALVLAAFVNLLVLQMAMLLVVALVLYEVVFKERGLVGNVWISLVVAATFLVGGVAAAVPRGAYDLASLSAGLGAPRLMVALIVALLAGLANTAREIFKDVEDVEADRGVRRSLPIQVGAARAMNVGRSVLGVAVLLLVAGLFRHRDQGATILFDYLLLLPSIGLFVWALSRRPAREAQRWTKVGMAAAIGAFFVIGLV